MATRKTSQAQHETPETGASNPFTALPGMEIWKTMMEAQQERFDALLGEMERLERERQERAVSAIDEMAKLMKSSLTYQQQLADEWRKMGLDAARKSASMMGTL